VLWRFSSEVVGATGFEPATPCAQGRCATRLRYAPTRQEYSENDARRHEALRRRAFVALCVAPCGAFRRGQANLARSRNDSGGGSELKLLKVVRTSGTCRRSRRAWSSARSTSSCVLEVVPSGTLETEMSEWLKEHAWKSTLAARSNAHQNATTHFRSTTSATTMCIAVSP
jgi:hypothetical protein